MYTLYCECTHNTCCIHNPYISLYQDTFEEEFHAALKGERVNLSGMIAFPQICQHIPALLHHKCPEVVIFSWVLSSINCYCTYIQRWAVR
jgi:hypothetical protein